MVRFGYGRLNCVLAAACVMALAGSRAAADDLILIGADAGGVSEVKAFDPPTYSVPHNFVVFTPSFLGGVRVATGDLTGDGVSDVFAVPGSGGPPLVVVFDGAAREPVHNFLAYEPTFTGGVFIATGDINGDGKSDIITGAGAGPGHVKAFDAVTGGEIRSFFAFDPSFDGGVQVATGDVNGDGLADIVVGAGPGAGPHVKVFDAATGTELHTFFAYESQFSGGVFVAAGDVNGDGFADIITGAGAGGGPHVKVFSGVNGDEIHSFFAYSGFLGGVRVASADINGDGLDDIITGPGPGFAPVVNIFSGRDESLLHTFLGLDASFMGGIFVSADNPIPEPSSVAMVGLAPLLLAGRRRA